MTRRLLSTSLVVLVAALGLVVVPPGPGGATSGTADAATPRTVVSLTFDDGHADQSSAVSALAASGLHGTFYINSGFTDGAGFLTRAQLQSMSAAGKEIGGHTISHPDLATLSGAEASRQICNDRANLLSWGFPVRSFAYPFASSSDALRTTVQDCGYASARGLGDLRSRFGCAGCSLAETVPPSSPYLTRAMTEVDSTWTLADLKAVVTAAGPRGGWVQLTFHRVCGGGCDPLAITPALFSQFTTWLAQRTRTTNTVVQTVGETVGGPVAPAVVVGGAPAAGPGVNAVQNPSLETGPASGAPACFSAGGYGANVPAFSVTAASRTGSRAQALGMSGYADGDAKLLPTLDLGECSPTVVPGHSYALGAWYTSTTVTQYSVYLRDAGGTWRYWTSSPWWGPTTAYARAEWTTPTVPAGSTGISFGLNIFADGRMTTDDYSMYDSAGAPTASRTAAPAPFWKGRVPVLHKPLRPGQIVVPPQERRDVRG